MRNSRKVTGFREWLMENAPWDVATAPVVMKRQKQDQRLAFRWMRAIEAAVEWLRNRLLPPRRRAAYSSDALMPKRGVLPDSHGRVRGDQGLTDDDAMPSQRMYGLEHLWRKANHPMHTWMAEHGGWPMRPCDICGKSARGENPSFLGHGVFGNAFKVGDDLVLKVTADESEAALSWEVSKLNLEDTMVIDVRALNNYTLSTGPTYGILQHFGSGDLPDGLVKASLLLKFFMARHVETNPSMWDSHDLPGQVMKSSTFLVDRLAPHTVDNPDEDTLKWVKVLIRIVNNILDVSGVIWIDPHMQNIMMDSMGRPKAIDLGQWVTRKGGEPLRTDGIPSV